MAIYTIHVPTAGLDAVTEADETVFIRDGFSGRAFLFGLFYLLWHRLWIAAFVWVLVLTALAAVAVVLHPPGFFTVALLGLMHLYLGAEASDLRRGGLDRRGCPLRDLVSAPDRDTAEAVFFARRPAPIAAPASRQPTRAWSATPAVIGIFPDGSGT